MRTFATLVRYLGPRATLGTFGAAALALACSGPTETPPKRPDVIAIVAGDAQSAYINHRLPVSLSVSVTTADGVARPGAAVEWLVTSGDGTLASASPVTDAGGLATATWTLGPTAGTQAVSVRLSGSANPGVSFTATALPLQAVLVRYDGSTWRTELADTNNVHMRLNGIWGPSASRAFSVGNCAATLLQLDNGLWNRVPAPCPVLTETMSLSGRSATDVYLIVHDALPPWFGTRVDHFDGNGFTTSFSRSCSSPCRPWLNGVWTAAGADVFVVGVGGSIFRFDGSSWIPLASGTTDTLQAVWGVTSNRVYAVGAAGTVLQYDGAVWTPMISGTSENLYGVWGTTVSDVYAVGAHGTLLHYDGAAWSSLNSGTTEDLHAISGSSGKLFAVGNNSTVVVFDGSRWTSSKIAMPLDLRGVWAPAATAVYAVGAPR